ncbi:MAG: pyridoxamine 5'-phosphate oxidase family protein [Pseudomonadota bacterium]
MDYDWLAALRAAVKKNRRDAHHRYLQLATLRADGAPANRTLVFRGFLQGSDQLQMVTDARSEKPVQIAGDARAELCWYFTSTREQFRLQGLLELIDARHTRLGSARDSVWQALSPAAKSQFFWPAPGRPLDPATPALDQAVDVDACAPAHFLLMLFQAEAVDHLCLKGAPQRRVLSRRVNGAWQAEAVNP